MKQKKETEKFNENEKKYLKHLLQNSSKKNIKS